MFNNLSRFNKENVSDGIDLEYYLCFINSVSMSVFCVNVYFGYQTRYIYFWPAFVDQLRWSIFSGAMIKPPSTPFPRGRCQCVASNTFCKYGRQCRFYPASSSTATEDHKTSSEKKNDPTTPGTTRSTTASTTATTLTGTLFSPLATWVLNTPMPNAPVIFLQCHLLVDHGRGPKSKH